MKKIIAIVLSVVCVFALFACGGESAYQKDAKEFIDAFKNTTVSSLNVTVVVDGSAGKLTSTYSTVYNEEGFGTMTYHIETIAGLDSAEDIDVKEGVVTVDPQGKVVNGDGKAPETIAPAGTKFDIGSSLIEKYQITGNTLTVTVDKEDSLAVIGVAAMSDVVIVVSKTSANTIASVSLSYTGSDGPVAIACVYN